MNRWRLLLLLLLAALAFGVCGGCPPGGLNETDRLVLAREAYGTAMRAAVVLIEAKKLTPAEEVEVLKAAVLIGDILDDWQADLAAGGDTASYAARFDAALAALEKYLAAREVTP